MMTHIRFTKMHGIGNDYLIVNGFEEAVDSPATLARAMTDRHTGVGADGLILVLPAEEGVEAHARMRIFNADGSEAEMCGNGIRCVGRFLHDRGICRANPTRIQTGAGVLSLTCELDEAGSVAQVTVDMGRPQKGCAAVGVDEAHLQRIDGGRCRITVGNEQFTGVLVSMGNPNFVVFCDRAEDIDLQRLGPAIEHHRAFPDRINVHFVQVHSAREVTVRTWERGSGATLACGTGAAAVCVAGAIGDATGRSITAHLPGGELRVRWDEGTDHVFMTGPAAEVFEGVWKGE